MTTLSNVIHSPVILLYFSSLLCHLPHCPVLFVVCQNKTKAKEDCLSLNKIKYDLTTDGKTSNLQQTMHYIGISV